MALPTRLCRCSRLSVVYPSRSRRPSSIRSEIGVLKTSFASSVYRRSAVKLSLSPSPPCPFRAVVALSSYRGRIVIVWSLCRRHTVAGPLSHRRRVKTPPLILETILHMSSELRISISIYIYISNTKNSNIWLLLFKMRIEINSKSILSSFIISNQIWIDKNDALGMPWN